MSGATLLNAGDPAFAFEHRRAHQTMLDEEARQGKNFNTVPYWLDPEYGDQNIPAGWANTLHVQAHGDFISLFPPPYGGNTLTLSDIALLPEVDPFWQFVNFQLHYQASLVQSA